MKSFSFQELLLVSYVERKARRIKFHPKKTVLKGENETGKSSILKSIYRTLGAEPEGGSPAWNGATVRSILRFKVNDTAYTALRHGDMFAIFDEHLKVLGRFSSVTNELAPFLSKLFGFTLRLPNRSRSFVDLPPAYLFLPFYMDQDGSWKQPWTAFRSLGQFANWKKGVVEYHAGIRGRQYYEAQAAKLAAEADLQRVEHRRGGLEEVYTDLSKKFEAAQFNVDYSAYRSEVEDLLSLCSKLRNREEAFKVELSDRLNQHDSLRTQLAITEHARNESHKDFEMAKDESQEIGCPTCGATYDNSFKERFLIAVDEDSCAELALQLSEELAKIEKEIDRIRLATRGVAEEVVEIERVLAKKEGELELRDLILQDGRKELKRAMADALAGLREDETRLKFKAYEDQQRMKMFDSAKRRKEVNDLYYDTMKQFASDLEIRTIPDDKLKRIDVAPGSTGSEGARVLLAYKVAFLHVMHEYGEFDRFPFVVDSPKQQEQDAGHSRRVLEFLDTKLPPGTQLIVGLVDAEGLAPGGNALVLDEPLRVLRESEFPEASDEMQELVGIALRGKSA